MIEVENLTKHYGSTLAVDNLSFTVPSGRVTGFLGPNGSGKSTTMRMILGLDQPNSGMARVNGKSYRSLRRPLLEIGALLDAGAIHGGRRAYEHLLCLALSNGISKQRVESVLETVGLTAVAKRRAGDFSLGMRQRLGIAAALLGDPPVLMFDEPVNGLDPEGVLWIRTLLRSLAEEGRTVFLSSHLMSEMAMTADRLIIIGRGRLILETEMDDFLSSGPQSFVRARVNDAPQLATLLDVPGVSVVRLDGDVLDVIGITTDAIGDIARENEITVRELSIHQPTLEQRYMELTKDVGDYSGRLAESGAVHG